MVEIQDTKGTPQKVNSIKQLESKGKTYHCVEIIKEYENSTIYLAKSPEICIIKEVHIYNFDEDIQVILDEVQKLTKIKHENILPIQDSFADNECMYVVMKHE